MASDFCKAIYDFEGKEESCQLTFEAGDIIQIMNRDPNESCDGWWLGEIRTGRHHGSSGLFPSVIVKDYFEGGGDDSANDLSASSPMSNIAPPTFSPPQIPSSPGKKIEMKSQEMPDENPVDRNLSKPPVVPSLHFDLVPDQKLSDDDDDDEPKKPEDLSMTLDMEIVVTSPTPLIQSPVSDDDEAFPKDQKDEKLSRNQPAEV